MLWIQHQHINYTAIPPEKARLNNTTDPAVGTVQLIKEGKILDKGNPAFSSNPHHSTYSIFTDNADCYLKQDASSLCLLPVCMCEKSTPYWLGVWEA